MPQTISLPQFNPSKAFTNHLVEVTQSSISTFNECQQKFVFRYMMHLTSPKANPAFMVGTIVHSALEYLLTPTPRTKAKIPADTSRILTAMVHSYYDDFIAKSDISVVVDPDTIEKCRVQTMAIIEAWQIVNCEWPQLFKVLHTEFAIRAPKGATTDMPPLARIAGKIDGLVLTKDTNQLYLLEHKTRSSLADTSFVNTLDLDQQCLFYATLYQKLVEQQPTLLSQLNVPKQGKHTQLPVGFYYDVMVKPQHRTGDAFQEKVNYMVERMIAEPAKYFLFIPVELSGEAVQWAARQFERTIERMDALKPGNVTLNLKACNAYGGSGCPYQTLCRAKADANDPAAVMRLPEVQLYRIQPPNEELNEE